jgi:hypothetical protein
MLQVVVSVDSRGTIRQVVQWGSAHEAREGGISKHQLTSANAMVWQALIICLAIDLHCIANRPANLILSVQALPRLGEGDPTDCSLISDILGRFNIIGIAG